MKKSEPGGEFKKSLPDIIKIQKRIDFDIDGNELVGTTDFWVVSANEDAISGPHTSLEMAIEAYNEYLNSLGL